MGFLNSIVKVGTLGLVDDFDGSDAAAGAAQQAAGIQSDATVRAAEISRQSTQDVIAANQAASETARADLAPFREAGVNALPGLSTAQDRVTSLATDPNTQASYVQDNPFFKALADDAQRRLFNNQAARGKVGSGGTAEALQNSVMLLGNSLVDQGIQREQGVFNNAYNITSLGSNAATGQANITQNTAANNANVAGSGNRTIVDLMTQGANAQAAGIVGAANANTTANQTGINALATAGGLMLSDERHKENIKFVGAVKGVPLYFFNYIGKKKGEFGTMAQKVEHIKNAVLDVGGKKYVNYGAL